MNLDLFDKILKSDLPIILFGTGSSGLAAAELLTKAGKKVAFFCDNEKSKYGEQVYGIKVLSPSVLSPDSGLVLITSDWARDIALQLNELGIIHYMYFGWAKNHWRWRNHFDPKIIKTHKEAIEHVKTLLHDEISLQTFESIIKFRVTGNPIHLKQADYEQYIHPVVYPTSNSLIVDGGAWTGDTAKVFQKIAPGSYIYMFEPDKRNIEYLQNIVSKNNKLEVIPAALWSESKVICFQEYSDSSRSMVSEQGKDKVRAVSLDIFFSERNCIPNLIKLDVEGSEMEALKGAKKLIREFGPSLQISIYHQPEDLWTIPIYIKELNPKYKIFIGHHTQHLLETICYATI